MRICFSGSKRLETRWPEDIRGVLWWQSHEMEFSIFRPEVIDTGQETRGFLSRP